MVCRLAHAALPRPDLVRAMCCHGLVRRTAQVYSTPAEAAAVGAAARQAMVSTYSVDRLARLVGVKVDGMGGKLGRAGKPRGISKGGWVGLFF